jgi:hypothetical protein
VIQGIPPRRCREAFIPSPRLCNRARSIRRPGVASLRRRRAQPRSALIRGDAARVRPSQSSADRPTRLISGPSFSEEAKACFRSIADIPEADYRPTMRALSAAKWSLILLGTSLFAVPRIFDCWAYVRIQSLESRPALRHSVLVRGGAVSSAPIGAIRSNENPRRFWPLTIGAWAFVAFWMFYQFVWMLWTHGGPWGW